MDWTTVPLAGLRARLALLGLCLASALHAAHAGPTELADVPMANASTATILPNIMLDIDNSGSMAWSYMPDYVRLQSGSGVFGTFCRGPDGNVTCEPGDPPFFASSFNNIYYNPTIRYVWPTKADGTRLPDKTSQANIAYTSWGAVPSDGYGVQSIDDSSAQPAGTTSCGSGYKCPKADDTIDLTAGYPDRTWCSNSSDKTTCQRAIDPISGYIYPNSTYKYLRVVKGAPFYYNVTVQWCQDKDSKYKSFGVVGNCQDKKTKDFPYVRYTGWTRVDIVSGKSYPKAPARTDCAGTTCSYDEEMSNFATWYAWYRTRAQMAKSAIGLSFKDVRGTPIDGDLIDANYLHARVGLTTINDPSTNKVEIDNFNNALSADTKINQKSQFYKNLYAINPSGGTPLRASLAAVGAMYGGTKDIYKVDPVQFSCQKNYAILTTDGYWNDDLKTKDNPYGEFVPPDPGTPDQDGGATRPSKDDLKTPNTLADVAYYYYHTDLRTTNCTSPKGKELCANNVTSAGSNQDVDDVAQHQHMTTFTIGLGVDGTLKYDPSYKASSSGDYFNILQGTKGYVWPKPQANQPETIDDLWHAAVNGRGTYFSAKNPAALESGLRKALSSIDSTKGSGAAAATSNLLPTQSDNSIYIATYRTLKWDAEVSAYALDLKTGAILPTPLWQAEPLLSARIQKDGTTDDRTILTGTYDVNGGIVTREFKSDPSVGLPNDLLNSYFNSKNLSQYAGWTKEQQDAATPASLLNYLRGQDHNEDQARPVGYPAYQRLYRDREKILGDVVHAQPIFVGQSYNTFSDPVFRAFKNQVSKRAGTLYVASNDGMLHAFDAKTGRENWAFIPPQVLPTLYRLADVNYESKHRYYLDGPLTINDAVVGGQWATVLIGAMGKGGRGYYALDITNPIAPKVLWDFTAEKNPNLGYSYGTPLITRRKDGKWVAIIASGYNNVPEDNGSGVIKYEKADGKGHIFVLDVATGEVLTTISTDQGDATNPSGLAWINAWVDKFDANNMEIVVYGGDLAGTMWRFDIENKTATRLIDLGADHPIMVAPELGEVPGHKDDQPEDRPKTVYFGTGRYLGKGDLTNVDKQYFYGIKDDNKNTVDASKLLAASASGTGATRAVTGTALDWEKDPGWYLPLIDKGERVSVNPRLYFGTVIFATTVPSSSECQPGGYSWLYQLDANTGGHINDKAGALKFNSPVVGVTASQLPNNGKPIIHAVTADGRLPDPTEMNIGLPPPDPQRVLYRELTN